MKTNVLIEGNYLTTNDYTPTLHKVADVDPYTSPASPQLLCKKQNIVTTETNRGVFVCVCVWPLSIGKTSNIDPVAHLWTSE